MQGTRVWALVREDPTCRGATQPVSHNYWACALEPASHNYRAYGLQLLKPTRSRACVLQLLSPHAYSPCNKKPQQREASAPQRRPNAAKNNNNKIKPTWWWCMIVLKKKKKKRSNEVCSSRLLAPNSLSLAIAVSFYLQMHLSHRRFISCFQGDREKGQSVPLASACFLSNFNLKWSLCRCGIFWSRPPWAPTTHTGWNACINFPASSAEHI